MPSFNCDENIKNKKIKEKKSIGERVRRRRRWLRCSGSGGASVGGKGKEEEVSSGGSGGGRRVGIYICLSSATWKIK